MFRLPTKRFTRDDKSTFIVQQMAPLQISDKMKVNQYHIFEPVKENGRTVIKRNIVYSEMNIFSDKSWAIANDFLSRSRLDRKVREAGGYIGYLVDGRNRTYNPALVKFFKTEAHRQGTRNVQRAVDTATKALTPGAISRSTVRAGVGIQDINNMNGQIRRQLDRQRSSRDI